MPLESATYISGLNASNPVGASDPKSQGDDHLRLIKSTLLNSFPGVTGAVSATHTELNYLDGITGVTGSGNLVASASPTFTGTITAAAISASGVVTAGGGSSSAPGFAIAGDTNTGIYSDTADTLGFAEGGTAYLVGFRNIPQNAQTGNYTLVLADAGKHIYHSSAAGSGDTYTIPANASVAYPLGTSITFINQASATVSIAITTDTMTLAGTTTTGTRTLAQNGVATAIKVSTTGWIISGSALS
jgi:hypothetical protein